MRLVKMLLHPQFKHTNLENQLHTSAESPNKGFNDTVFQYFVDK